MGFLCPTMSGKCSLSSFSPPNQNSFLLLFLFKLRRKSRPLKVSLFTVKKHFYYNLPKNLINFILVTFLSHTLPSDYHLYLFLDFVSEIQAKQKEITAIKLNVLFNFKIYIHKVISLYATHPKPLPLPLVGGESVLTWPLWAVLCPNPNAARDDFLLCLAFLWMHSFPSALFTSP